MPVDMGSYADLRSKIPRPEVALAAAWVIGSMVVEPATRISVWAAELAPFAFACFDTSDEKVPRMVPTATAPMTATTIRTRVATIGEIAVSLFLRFIAYITVSPLVFVDGICRKIFSIKGFATEFLLVKFIHPP